MNATPTRSTSGAARPSTMLVRDFMTAMPYTIGRKQTLAVAQEKMRAGGVRHLPVLDGGRLAGVISQRDAYFIETLSGVTPETLAVEEAMSTEVYTVRPETPLLEVATAMADHKYGCAIVTQDNRVVGVFTTVDALRALVASNAATG